MMVFAINCGRGAVRIEIAQHAVHPGLRQLEIVVAEARVGLEDRVIVQKELQILADHEHVEELLMHDLEFRDGRPFQGSWMAKVSWTGWPGSSARGTVLSSM